MKEIIAVTYKKIWFELHQNCRSWKPSELEFYLKLINLIKNDQRFFNELKKVVSEPYKLITIKDNGCTNSQLLDQIGISIENVYKSLRFTQADQHCDWREIQKLEGCPRDFQREYGRILRAYQEETISNGFMEVICPFTGKPIRTIHSFPIGQAIFYRFESQDVQEVFYLISIKVSTGYNLDAVYFPRREILINMVPPKLRTNLQNHVNKLKLNLLTNLEKVADYLLMLRPNKIVVTLGHINFAHHLYNQLEALQRIQENGCLGKVDEFWVSHEPLGAIDEIFPEIRPGKVKKIKNMNVLKTTLDSKALAIKVGDRYVSDELRQRIYATSLKNCQPAFLDLVKKAKDSCYPLLWVSIRIVNRTCVNQVEALVNIILHLVHDYPKLGVVFDGFSLPADFNNSNSRNQDKKYGMISFSDENVNNIRRVEEDIISQLDGKVSTFDAVGCILPESVIWAHYVDLYFCHHGTTQHKVGWLANKPGVVHSNQGVLSHPAYPEAKGSWVNCKNAVYLPASSVVDREVSPKFKKAQRKDLRNYYLNWETAYIELLKILKHIEH